MHSWRFVVLHGPVDHCAASPVRRDLEAISRLCCWGNLPCGNCTHLRRLFVADCSSVTACTRRRELPHSHRGFMYLYHVRRSVDNPLKVSMLSRCFATRAATATSTGGGRRGAGCRSVLASVAVVGYASTTSASAFVVGSCDPSSLISAPTGSLPLRGGAEH